MVKSNMCYYKSIIFCLVLVANFAYGQGNCFLYPEDSGERIACELSYRAIEYRQGSRASQLLFDRAIEIGPKYAWAYYEKSVPFFKRGMFAEGVQLINKAIELEQKNYLYYRAYWYFYNRSYAHCIRDLELLYSTYKASHTFIPSGELEMRMLLAMAYAYTGNVQRGIGWIKHLMDSYKDQPHIKGNYDHFCLGILYFKANQLDNALLEFEKQLTIDDRFASTYYYMGLIHVQKEDLDAANKYFKTALDLFNAVNEGYNVGFFTEMNVRKSDVEKMLTQSE